MGAQPAISNRQIRWGRGGTVGRWYHRRARCYPGGAMSPLARWLPVLLLLNACATMPKCPGQGGPEWRELRSEHFVLNTDMRSGKARDALEELETLRMAVLAAAFPAASRQPTGRIPVIIVEDIDEWEEYFPHNGGMFTEALWQPL